jgi:SPP1 family predicted phage head-tail adaptor
MRAGQFDRVIQIWRLTEIGRDPIFNTPVLEWNSVHTIRARATFLRAAERIGAGQEFAVKELRFTTRYFDDLQATDVIRFDGQNYDVEGIAEIGRREGLEISATWRQGGLEVPA